MTTQDRGEGGKALTDAKWEQVGFPRVRGRCPSCGSDSLFLGSNGYVTCAVIGCKDPGAPTDVLAVGVESDAWQWRNRALVAEAQLQARQPPPSVSEGPEASLREYVQHTPDCMRFGGFDSQFNIVQLEQNGCTCGLSALLAL